MAYVNPPPPPQGSTYLYKKVVHPALRKNEDYIDRSIDDVKNRGYDYTSQWARLAMQNFSRALMEVNLDPKESLNVRKFVGTFLLPLFGQ